MMLCHFFYISINATYGTFFFNFKYPRIWKAADISFHKFSNRFSTKDRSLPNRTDRISVMSKISILALI